MKVIFERFITDKRYILSFMREKMSNVISFIFLKNGFFSPLFSFGFDSNTKTDPFNG